MKTDIKLRVTPEQSEAVQKICFANNVIWSVGEDKISYTEAEYLFIEPPRIWFRGITNHDSGMETVGYTEVDADLFIRTNGTCEESVELVNNLSNSKSKEDMFKQYGFKVPDFDCTILAKVNRDYVGYTTDNDDVIALSWSLSGTCYTGITYATKYNLTPIKKPWYETCKFPVLVMDNVGDTFVINTRKECNGIYLGVCRPLSNDEIDQLKQDF